jgi:ferric-dicitrate binding protein FerR (iron transport regulator)
VAIKKLLGMALLLGVVCATGVVWWIWERETGTIRVALADGTSAVCARGSVLSTESGHPGKRFAVLDGECWIGVVAGPAALVLRSRLMVLTVPGAARIHVVARARESGEQVEVLEGTVTAAKNYSSAHSTPDDLAAGEMSMVNRSIDLQEKEKMNEKEWAAARAAFRLP